MTEKRKSLHAKLFAAQKELDAKLKGEQLLGAMRQTLHAHRLFVSMTASNLTAGEHVASRYAFTLRHGQEQEDHSIDLLRSDFKDAQEQLQFAWEAYLHGLFCLPKSKEIPKPIGIKVS
jgi:hypothetical protein